MARKLQITQEFLWQIYELLEGIDSVYERIAFRSMSDVVNPELRKLRLRYEQKKRGRTFSQFLSYLKRQGYIKTPQGKPLQLTEKGRRKAMEGKAKGTKWSARKDGRMIMLLYDIPKEKSSVRYAFRDALVALDYEMFQKSVWVSDKEVFEKTRQTIHDFGLDSFVDMFLIEKIRVHK